jgi:hypothetical protein
MKAKSRERFLAFFVPIRRGAIFCVSRVQGAKVSRLLLAFLFYLVEDINPMRQALLLTALLLLTCFAFGQKKRPARLPGPPTKAEEEIADRNFQCLHIDRYTVTERRAFFPFGSASTIKLISFEVPEPPEAIIYGDDGKIIGGDREKIDTVDVITPMAPDRFVINYRKIKEEKILDVTGINRLTDILYNVGFTPVKNLTLQIANPGYSCYEPRNAILFLDIKGNVTQYIEFCFQCERHYYSSSKTKTIDYCEQKYDMLATFFLRQGLKYGVENIIR